MTLTAVLLYIAAGTILSAALFVGTEKAKATRNRNYRKAAAQGYITGFIATSTIMGILFAPSMFLYLALAFSAGAGIAIFVYSALLRDLKADIDALTAARKADKSTIDFKNELIGLKEERIAGLMASLRAADRRNADH